MSTEFTVEVLQYLMPDGRTRPETTELPIAVKPLYNAMVASGHRFEAEMLSTGEVSVTIFCPASDEDVDIEVVPNGPEVQEALAKMLENRMWEATTPQGELP